MSIPEFAHRAIWSFWFLSVMLKTYMFNDYQFYFFSSIYWIWKVIRQWWSKQCETFAFCDKKKKEICHLTSPNWVFWHASKDKNVRVDHRIWNSLIAGGVFNRFFGYGFIFIYNLCVCKSESTLSHQEMDEKRKK